MIDPFWGGSNKKNNGKHFSTNKTSTYSSKIPQKIWKNSLPKKTSPSKRRRSLDLKKTPGSPQRLGMRSNPPRPRPWSSMGGVKWFSVFLQTRSVSLLVGFWKNIWCVFFVKLIDLRMVLRCVKSSSAWFTFSGKTWWFTLLSRWFSFFLRWLNGISTMEAHHEYVEYPIRLKQ